ncbi:MAG: hypothetical protein ACD_73C00020G0003, partial [uncultured bacterium]
LNNLKDREALGFKARSPRWAFAWKFKPRSETTIVDDVVIQVGRQGTLTPVAILRPVDVGGVTVSRATLHNMDFVDKLDVRIKDHVRIARAGDVIPEVIEVIKDKRTPEHKKVMAPEKCPVCDSPAVREGSFYYCNNGFICPAQKKWALIHFASRLAMDIEGLGEETVEQLVSKELVGTPADLYDLTEEILLQLEGFKSKKIANLLKAIQESKQRTLSRFIFALGIRHVGQESARLLAKNFADINDIANANIEELQKIRGIGPEIAEGIHSYFSNQANQNLLKDLISKGLHFIPERDFESQMLAGKTFVVTGELKSMSRTEIEEKINLMGGHATNSVSKKTSYVIVGENPGSKYQKALDLGVPILGEEEFMKMVTQ